MTEINYYIDIDGSKIYCGGSDKIKAISFFQSNKDQLKTTYGDLSGATLVREVTEVYTKVEMKLDEVIFILICTPPKSDGWNYYVSKTSDGYPIIVPGYNDMIKGNLSFHSEDSAKIWIEKHKNQLETLYTKEVTDTIKIMPMSLAEIVAAREQINRKEGL